MTLGSLNVGEVNDNRILGGWRGHVGTPITIMLMITEMQGGHRR